MRGKTLLFWGGVVFTLVVPICIGLIYKSTGIALVAAFCGAFVTFMARIEDLAELSLGPVRAKMRETIREANATIEQLRDVAASSAKAILTDLMAGGFMGGMHLKTRLELHDQIIKALRDIGASELAIKNAEDMWCKGVCLIYHRAIRVAFEGRDEPNQINMKATPEVREASRQLEDMVQFEKWQAPTPDQIESFIKSKGLMNPEVSEWLSD